MTDDRGTWVSYYDKLFNKSNNLSAYLDVITTQKEI